MEFPEDDLVEISSAFLSAVSVNSAISTNGNASQTSGILDPDQPNLPDASVMTAASPNASTVKSRNFPAAASVKNAEAPSLNEILRAFNLQTANNQNLSSESGIGVTKALMKWHGEIRKEHAKVQKWISFAEAKKRELESRAAMLEVCARFVVSLPVEACLDDVLDLDTPSGNVQTAKSPTMSEFEVFDKMAGLSDSLKSHELETCVSSSFEKFSGSQDSSSSSSYSSADTSSDSTSNSSSGSSASSSGSSASSD